MHCLLTEVVASTAFGLVTKLVVNQCLVAEISIAIVFTSDNKDSYQKCTEPLKCRNR